MLPIPKSPPLDFRSFGLPPNKKNSGHAPGDLQKVDDPDFEGAEELRAPVGDWRQRAAGVTRLVRLMLTSRRPLADKTPNNSHTLTHSRDKPDGQPEHQQYTSDSRLLTAD